MTSKASVKLLGVSLRAGLLRAPLPLGPAGRMRHDIPEVKDRRGNWVQQYGPEEDARLFATAQFRRYRDVAEKHLPKLKEIQSITKQIKGGAK